MSVVQTLDELRQALARCAALLTEHRTDLIESLGDRLCGSGDGPSAEEVDRLHTLEQMHDTLRVAYGERLLTMAVGEQV
ncbi:hypothetical protein [Variovorax sp. ZT4R33]|uniref:hypothetical protein n=1 Tax=Variovorax sp. ZT4R33 TaxID=3443743 RepID=UPI003F4898E6